MIIHKLFNDYPQFFVCNFCVILFLISHRIEIDFHFEKAYCLYRLNKTEEALDILNAIAEPSEHEKELKAQVVRSLIHYYNTTFQAQRKISLNL